MKERELEESGGAGVMLMCPDLEELPEKYGDRRGQIMPLSNLPPTRLLLQFGPLLGSVILFALVISLCLLSGLHVAGIFAGLPHYAHLPAGFVQPDRTIASPRAGSFRSQKRFEMR
jgi:hypothetical protein